MNQFVHNQVNPIHLLTWALGDRRTGQILPGPQYLGAYENNTRSVSVFSSLQCFGLQGCARSELQIVYYYESYCASCYEDREFYELFAQYESAIADTPYSLRVENTAQTGRGNFLEQCNRLEIPEEERSLPALFVGDAYLTGKDAIAQGIGVALNGQDDSLQAAEMPPDPDPDEEHVVYFYTSPCMDCSRVRQWLAPFLEQNPQLHCEEYSILDPTGLAILEAAFQNGKCRRRRGRSRSFFMRVDFFRAQTQSRKGCPNCSPRARCKIFGIRTQAGKRTRRP